MELTQSACLRALMPEAGKLIEHLLRECLCEHAVLQHGADGACRTFGAQREFGLPCNDGVHFLLHDVGRLTDRALEQLGLLKGRDTDFGEAEAFRDIPCHLLSGIPLADAVRCDVLCAVRTFQIICHKKTLSL